MRKAKRYREAEKVELEVIKGREKLLGPNHEDTLWTKCNYAVTLKNLKRYEEAEKLYLEVIEKSEASLGPDNYLQSFARQNL